MSSLSLHPLIRRRWQARPSWTSPLAVALGLHALLLAVPGGFEPLPNAASLAPASRGALVDLSDQLGLPISGSTALETLRLPGMTSLPLPAQEIAPLPAPSLPPVIKPATSQANPADAQLISLDPAAGVPQPQSLGSTPEPQSLESILNSITSEDQPLGLSLAVPSSFALELLALNTTTPWIKTLSRLTFDLSWFQGPGYRWDLQRLATEELPWPDSSKFVVGFRLKP